MADDRDEAVDGPGIAAKILARMQNQNKDRIVAAIERKAPELAAKIQEKLFNFDDITELTPQGIQVLLKEVDAKDLVLSLKTASPKAKAFIFQNMTERKAQIVQDELTAMPPSRLSEVEGAQRRILEKMEELRRKYGM